MQKNLKRTLLTAAALCCTLLLCGSPSSCDPKYWMDPENYEELQRPPSSRFTIHKIVKYRQGKETERTIPTYSRREVTVDMPWFPPKMWKKLRRVPVHQSPAITI